MYQLQGPGGVRLTPTAIAQRLRLDATSQHSPLTKPEEPPPFSWAHLGRSDLTVGELLATIAQATDLRPPRTGHVGNWGDVVAGRAGAMDFNQAACLHGSAYPLLYPFNKTEDTTLTAGDWAYAPASRVVRGRRRLLPLYTWNDGRLAARDHSAPLFVPFVLSELGGEVVPLIDLHRECAPAHPEFSFRLESTLLAEHEADVRDMLTELVDAARASVHPRRSFADLIDCEVALDGRIRRSAVGVDGDGYWLGDQQFRNTPALVDAMMVPLRAAAAPREFHSTPREHAGRYPVISGHLMGLLAAALSSHYPGGVTDRASMTQPFNPHLVWGARAMAGFPPHEPGYFARRSTLRALAWMAQTLVSGLDIDPICFVVLPAAVFLLCPPDTHPEDEAALAPLLDAVQAVGRPAAADDLWMQRSVDEAVETWLNGEGRSMSAYFRHRFAHRSGVVHGFAELDTSRPVLSSEILGLSLRQACMTVGSLSAAFASHSEIGEKA